MLLKKMGLGAMAVVGGVLASACCTLPLLAVFLGVSLIPAAGIAMLANARPFFVVLAAMALGLMYYIVFVNKKTCCTPKEVKVQSLWFLIMAAVVLLGITSPYWILLFH